MEEFQIASSLMKRITIIIAIDTRIVFFYVDGFLRHSFVEKENHLKPLKSLIQEHILY